MPIYEYHCPACGEEFEKLVFGQAAVSCPGCASRDVGRRLSVFGLKSGSTFVGSGGGCGSGCGCGARGG
ncbi:MAG: FmdB family zinc ribbon protein [Actinomycetota bacterium]